MFNHINKFIFDNYKYNFNYNYNFNYAIFIKILFFMTTSIFTPYIFTQLLTPL